MAARSPMAPSVTSPVAPRYFRRVARMSPVTRTPTSPRASMTSTSPGSIVSNARRWSEAAPARVAATSPRGGNVRVEDQHVARLDRLEGPAVERGRAGLRGGHVLAGGQRAGREGAPDKALLRSARRHAGQERVPVAAALQDLADGRDADGLQLRQDVIGNRHPLDPETAVTAAGFRHV